MALGTVTLTELRLEPAGFSGKITCPSALRPAPGQYLTASSPDTNEPLPAILFPSQLEADGVRVAAPLPSGWTAGMKLTLRGPLGNGFHMPGTARRVALAGLDGGSARLMPLALQALFQQAAVTLYAPEAPAGLPDEVEVLPLDLLPEALQWADFVALDVSRPALGNLRPYLGLNPFHRPACQIQILVRTAMPCGGLAECGVCAVPGRGGWLLACSDGPVFDFNQIEEG
jgi:NAD(P)H-flavin reductase